MEDAGRDHFTTFDQFSEQTIEGWDAWQTGRVVFEQVEEGMAVITLIAQEDTVGALEQEQADEPLPGVFAVGDIEYFGTPEHVIAIESHFLETEIAIFDEIFMQEGKDMTDATGLVEGLVEFLAAADGVGFGQTVPGTGGGELPENAIEQEAFGPGYEA